MNNENKDFLLKVQNLKNSSNKTIKAEKKKRTFKKINLYKIIPILMSLLFFISIFILLIIISLEDIFNFSALKSISSIDTNISKEIKNIPTINNLLFLENNSSLIITITTIFIIISSIYFVMIFIKKIKKNKINFKGNRFIKFLFTPNFFDETRE